MDLKLIPVCSEKEHIMEYNYSEKYNCDICNHRGISYNCINCEYYRCSKCHRDILSKGGDKHGGLRVSHSDLIKIRKDEQFRIDKDGLFDWIVRTSSEDMGLYYYNVITKTISYDYPITSPPNISPETILKDNPLSENFIYSSEGILTENNNTEIKNNNTEIENNNFIFRIMKCVKDRWSY
tara:strand:+ start:66 stop:608 length:543 start_codon:yes stop_codon:yes gene_type:complete